MNGVEDFLVLRYSLVEEPQLPLRVRDVPVPKGASILVAIERDIEFYINRVKYSFVGFLPVNPMNSDKFPQGRFYIGKVAKLKKAHVGQKIPGDILETEADDWFPVRAIFDIVDQYIFVRKDWRFGTPEQIARAIQGGLRGPVLAHYNHTVFVEGRTKKEHFWRIVSEHRKLYKLELRLISPNILETNLRAREALAGLKQLFGQDRVDVMLSSDTGNLKVPEQPVDSYLDYIEQGEGGWAVTTEGFYGGKKKYTSAENIDTVAIPVMGEVEEIKDQLLLDAIERPPVRDSADISIVSAVFAEIERYRER